MDKNLRNQLCFIIVGLFLLPFGIYLFTLGVEYIISSTVSLSGTVLLISGIRYKERLKRRVLKGDERDAYLRSGYFVISMIGVVILFGSLGGGLLLNYMHVNISGFWYLGIAFVGMLLIVGGRFLKKDTYKT